MIRAATVSCNRLLGAIGSGTSGYALACSAETGRSNAGLKNRLAMAAKIIGAKPITAAEASSPARAMGPKPPILSTSAV